MKQSQKSPRIGRGTIMGALVAISVAMTACGGSSSSSSSASSTSADAGTAAAAPAGGSGIKVTAVTHASQGDSFWATVDNGMKAAAKNLGVSLDIQVSGGDPAKQGQLVQEALNNKADVIVVSLPDPGAMKAPVKAAFAANIPVISFNSGGTVYQTLGIPAHIGEDEGVAGEGVGQRWNQAGVKKVLCVEQEQGNIGLTNYCNGIDKTFNGTLKTTFVNGTKDVAGSQASIKAAVAADPSIDAVFVLSPDLGPAAVQAVADANSKAKIGVWNLSKGVIQGVIDGKILFADDSEPYLQGYLAVQTAVLYKNNLLLPGGGHPVLTGPTFVDKSNAAAILDLTTKGQR